MNTDLIYEQVVTIACEALMVEPSTITPETRLEELGATSLDVVTIALELEDKFGREMFTDDNQKFVTISEIVDHVRIYLQQVGE